MTDAVASVVAMDGAEWVTGWLRARYDNEGTHRLYAAAWQRFGRYFAERKVTSLTQIDRQLLYDYVLWRTDAGRNTAVQELQILSAILHEATRRSIIPANPAVRLGFRDQPRKIKPEIPDNIIREIEEAIEREPLPHMRHFFRVSFAIARWHGVRIRETRFPLSNVDFAANVIRFDMKGKKEPHVVPLHPRLRPILEELALRGDTYTFAEPSNPGSMAARWSQFLRKAGITKKLPGLSFHCLRVSCITKLARANVAQSKAMRYVAHSSTAVHAIYIRTKLDDLQDCLTALAALIPPLLWV